MNLEMLEKTRRPRADFKSLKTIGAGDNGKCSRNATWRRLTIGWRARMEFGYCSLEESSRSHV